MHRHRIPQFAGLGALADLSGDLEAAGIDISDWAPTALEAVSYEGGIYGVPMDFHANLWHVNLDLLAQAGLVTDEGTPILPPAHGIAGPMPVSSKRRPGRITSPPISRSSRSACASSCR